MASKIFLLCLVLFTSSVKSDSLIERSYEYVMKFGKNLAPSVMSILDCFGEEDAWACAKEKAGKILSSWDQEVQKQRNIWAAEADAEVSSSGRSFEEPPSLLGREIEHSLTGVTDLIQKGMTRALSRKKHESSGGIDLTISPSTDKKKKMKKKKQKPPKIQLIQPVMMTTNKDDKGRGFGRLQTWVVGNMTKGRGFISNIWNVGEKALDTVAEHVIEQENVENGIVDRSSVEEQRGKKKKKKKAILKLLILGAVLKAKIGTLLQILSFKLQVKFFIIALIGLAINLARFWVELKNKHNQQPQKVIYYEHAQHQHHYEHEDESPGWGPWSRSMEPEDPEAEPAILHTDNSPYRAYERNAQVSTRPLLTLS